MKIKKGNRGLLNKKRFEKLEKEEIKYLQKMSIEESINLMEELLDSGFVEECRRIQKQLGINKWSEK